MGAIKLYLQNQDQNCSEVACLFMLSQFSGNWKGYHTGVAHLQELSAEDHLAKGFLKACLHVCMKFWPTRRVLMKGAPLPFLGD